MNVSAKYAVKDDKIYNTINFQTSKRKKNPDTLHMTLNLHIQVHWLGLRLIAIYGSGSQLV